MVWLGGDGGEGIWLGWEGGWNRLSNRRYIGLSNIYSASDQNDLLNTNAIKGHYNTAIVHEFVFI